MASDVTRQATQPAEQRPYWWRYDEYQCPVCGRGQGEFERTRTYDESEKGYHQHVRYDWCEG